MGWALKQSRSRNIRFTDQQKDYLMAKFQTGEQTGQKADAASVSRRKREQLLDYSEFLTSRQISSFFLVWPQSEVSTTKRNQSDDNEQIRAEKESQLQAMRKKVHAHPILYNDYSVCELVRNSKLSNFSIKMLNDICISVGLDTSRVNVKRKKPYVDTLTSLVVGCQCQANGE
ncbi:hypothetical protein pdam_00016322 [Pocillopora damicornis]|uniref:Uncharacterized protein n=1 Tax=Pocillopora damicornis TaxID=46731 RepID=A0A3M6UZ55_POCDA|nr:hypothetical protein pdam_00016322 [Pocillopora damicornis]